MIILLAPITVYSAKMVPLEIDESISTEPTDPMGFDSNTLFKNTLFAVMKIFKVAFIISSVYLLIETIVIIKKGNIDNKVIKVFNIIINILISIPVGLCCGVIPTITNTIKVFSDNNKTKIKMNVISITLFVIACFVVIPIITNGFHGGYYAKPI